MPAIGVVSDIHSNLPAVTAVMRHMQDRWHVSEVWCLGDLVGYNAHPVQVLDNIWTRMNVTIKGNHDDALGRGAIPEYFDSLASASLRWSYYKTPIPWRQALHALPSMRVLSRSDRRLLLAHGGPRYPMDQCVWPNSDMSDLRLFMELTDLQGMLFGNTHIPFAHKEDEFLIANPGSVGQPRDGDPRASYAILDTDEWKVSFERVSYDIDAECAAIERAQLPLGLIERLKKGE